MSFKFEQLGIWKQGITITADLIKISNDLQTDKLFVYSDQLRRASLSITNNIAEGSGSVSSKEFARYLTIARGSLFECVNILTVLKMENQIDSRRFDVLYQELEMLSQKISSFRSSLANSN